MYFSGSPLGGIQKTVGHLKAVTLLRSTLCLIPNLHWWLAHYGYLVHVEGVKGGGKEEKREGGRKESKRQLPLRGFRLSASDFL